MPSKKSSTDDPNDRPATRGMLEAVRQELKHEMQTGFHELKSEIRGLDSKINGLDSKINGLESKVHGVQATVEKILTAVSQMQLNFEQQRSDNRIVFEKLGVISKRQDAIEDNLKPRN